jgi:hypothetical protein
MLRHSQCSIFALALAAIAKRARAVAVRLATSCLIGLGAATAASAQGVFPPLPTAHGGARVTVVASGLHDPRGLALGAGDSLYVAEAGIDEGAFVPPPPPAPTEPPTRTRCEVYWPVGPKTPGNTARISRIERSGSVVPVVVGGPSTAPPNPPAAATSGKRR